MEQISFNLDEHIHLAIEHGFAASAGMICAMCA